jgi:hypothetical protein
MLPLDPHDSGLGGCQAWNLLGGDPHQGWDLGQGGCCRADPPDWQELKLIKLSFHFTVTSPALVIVRNGLR